jgi:transposase
MECFAGLYVSMDETAICVAVARKLAVVMHAMWRDGTFYVGDPTASAQDVAAWATAKEKRLSYAQS